MAVSRAVRSPSRLDQDFRIGPISQPIFVGNPAFTSEKVIAYELGYRAQLGQRFLYDISTYYNRYRDLRSQERITSVLFPRMFSNGLRATNYGVELATKRQVVEKWRLQLNETFLHELFSMLRGAPILRAVLLRPTILNT